ncbi:MAG: acetyltransferase [Prochlorococcaceae cyanobacterium]
MFLKVRHEDQALLEVQDLKQLFDPFASHVQGRLHVGEEMQESESFAKSNLMFPSGEALPRCWMEGHRHGA